MLQSNDLCFEFCDNYTKQTYRNRTTIYGANGKLQLNIPVSHSQKERQLYRDVRITNEQNWQSQHLKSLQSAYRTSPFYEYYEDELLPLFELETKYLMDFNYKCLEVVLDCMQIELQYSKSKSYKAPSNEQDYRELVNCKKEIQQDLKPYTQVFSDKLGFLSNLSILDLLFNEGPNAQMYLEAQVIKLANTN